MRSLLCVLVGVAACSSEVDEGEILAILDDAREMQATEDVLREQFEAFAYFDLQPTAANLAIIIEDYWATEVPCGTTTRAGSAITINYGDIDEKCTWRGTALGGQHVVTVRASTSEEISMRHSFSEYTNGVVTLNGDAVVSWEPGTLTREASYDYSWTNEAGRTRDVVGINTHGIVDSELGLRGVVTLDGDRWWGDSEGSSTLDLVGVAYRFADPVPEAGQWDFLVRRTEQVSLQFSRIDGSNYQVDVEGAQRPYSWNINQQGEVTRR